MALLITMIFLVILTYLGVSTIQDTNLEEKMAANLYHSNIVFQAAESALRDGEKKLTGTAALPTFNDTSGYFTAAYDLDSFLNSASWASASCSGGWLECQTVAGLKTGFVIQEMPALNTDDSLEVGTPQDTDRYYRVSAKAESANTSAVVIVQSIYRR
ncbi:MAG: PilX N-terminal domain-containing pilus assembly protein [Motiliproteus sp.]